MNTFLYWTKATLEAIVQTVLYSIVLATIALFGLCVLVALVPGIHL